MKPDRLIIVLIVSTITLYCGISYARYQGWIVDTTITPMIAGWALLTTLIGLYISTKLWQKNRLETEFLKIQLGLINDYLKHLQKHNNFGFCISTLESRTMKGAVAQFSAINYQALKALDENNRFVVTRLPMSVVTYNFFYELDCEIVRNPLFPKSLHRVISKLDTSKYFLSQDYAKNWYQDIQISADQQFVLSRNLDTDELENKAIRIPFKNDYMKISDLINVFDEFNKVLEDWLKSNHIEVDFLVSYS